MGQEFRQSYRVSVFFQTCNIMLITYLCIFFVLLLLLFLFREFKGHKNWVTVSTCAFALYLRFLTQYILLSGLSVSRVESSV